MWRQGRLDAGGGFPRLGALGRRHPTDPSSWQQPLGAARWGSGLGLGQAATGLLPPLSLLPPQPSPSPPLLGLHRQGWGCTRPPLPTLGLG